MKRWWLVASVLLLSVSLQAEQMQKFGDWEVHYILVPTTFLKPAIAEQYGIVRGRDRAYLNISVLDRGLDPVPVDIDGTMTNLLGQQQHLEFQEFRPKLRNKVFVDSDILGVRRDHKLNG